MDKELCGKSYELANGHFATCHLPKGHEGRCTGFLTGEMAGTVILWDGKYESEEYQYLKENINKLKGDVKMKKWLLEARLESGMGVNQVKVGELMDGCKSDDECKEIISTLLNAGETKEYKENVFLRLGEFEGATLEDAFNKYFEEFDGDDQNELFFAHQIDAKELASSGCACGGSCGGHSDKTQDEFNFTESDDVVQGSIDSGELFIQEKVVVWKECRYKLKEGATLESVREDLRNGNWRQWDYDSSDMEVITETEEALEGSGTLEVYNRNNVKLGSN